MIFTEHVVNFWLIYWLSTKLSGNEISAMTAAIAFGFCAIIADTILVPGFLVFIIVTSLFILAIGLHPVYNQDTGGLSLVLFILVNALSPWLMEIGFVTILASMGLFLIHKQLDVLVLSLLILFLLIPLCLRFVLSIEII